MEYKILLGAGAHIDDTISAKAMRADLVQEHIASWTEQLCAVFGGCTMSIVDGNYVMQDGSLCTESSFQFTCIKFGDNTIEQAQAWIEVKLIARDMCKVFEQECVLISRHACDAELVEA
ncbi:hypothetical protein ABMA70_15910 [Halobacteriovorax sp. XZX-3]|uniref:hypothetical protein n=1 Tax=unclassified Halobacteriovorax TaxID=2639665 RepID=UPI0037115A3A